MGALLYLAAAAGAGAACWAALRRGGRRVRRGMLVGAVLLGLLLAFDVVAFATDLWGAYAAVECSSSCTAIQALVRWSFAFGVPLLAAMGVALTLDAVRERLR